MNVDVLQVPTVSNKQLLMYVLWISNHGSEIQWRNSIL